MIFCVKSQPTQFNTSCLVANSNKQKILKNVFKEFIGSSQNQTFKIQKEKKKEWWCKINSEKSVMTE